MYVFGCTLMSKPSVHCGSTELFNIEKKSFIVTRLSYMIERMKAISEGSRENVKAPSCCLSCKSNARLSIAEKCGANNQREQSKAPLTVRYEIHTSAQPIQQRNWRSKSDNQSMGR
jgi:hypothetical protein